MLFFYRFFAILKFLTITRDERGAREPPAVNVFRLAFLRTSPHRSG